jgi:hypothetical protein
VRTATRCFCLMSAPATASVNGCNVLIGQVALAHHFAVITSIKGGVDVPHPAAADKLRHFVAVADQPADGGV